MFLNGRMNSVLLVLFEVVMSDTCLGLFEGNNKCSSRG